MLVPSLSGRSSHPTWPALSSVASAPIALHDVELGRLQLATALDEDYARELSELSGASMVIASSRSIVASTLNAEARRALKTDLLERPLPTTRALIGDRATDEAVLELRPFQIVTLRLRPAHGGQVRL